MPDTAQMLTVAVYAIAFIFALMQLFLSLRPPFFWGLLMPLMFIAFWLIFTSSTGIIADMLGINEMAANFYRRTGQSGLMLSLFIYIPCRIAKFLKYYNSSSNQWWRQWKQALATDKKSDSDKAAS